jgi:hypothetical protein
MKYYFFNENNVGVSYNDEIPDGAIECTMDVYNNPRGYKFEGGQLIAPTSEELEQIQKMDAISAADLKKTTLKSAADAEISWRQDAVDAGIATTEETTALSEWKKYRVLLMRIDTSKAPDIEWPPVPVS